MASWDEVKEQLRRYDIAGEREREIVIRWPKDGDAPAFAVVVRMVRALGTDWLRVGAAIGQAKHVPLEAILRHAESLVGAVVIEGQRCILRESVCLAHIAPLAVHVLVESVAHQAAKLSALTRAQREPHPYATEFAT